MKRVFLLLAIAGMMVACMGNDKRGDEGAKGTEQSGEKSLAESYYEAIQSGDEEAIKAMEKRIKALSKEEKLEIEKQFHELEREDGKAKPQRAKSLAQRMIEAEDNEDYEAMEAILEEYYALSFTEQKAADLEYKRLCEQREAEAVYDYDYDYDYDVIPVEAPVEAEVVYDYDFDYDYDYDVIPAEAVEPAYYYDDYDYDYDYSYTSNRGEELAQRAIEAYLLGDSEGLDAMDAEYEALTQSEQEAFEAEIYRLLSTVNEVEDYTYDYDEVAQEVDDDYYYYY